MSLLAHMLGLSPVTVNSAGVRKNLLDRLRNDLKLKIDSDAKVIRYYPGHWQRAAGAWSWGIHQKDLYPQIGSQYPMNKIVRAKKIVASREDSNIHIDID